MTLTFYDIEKVIAEIGPIPAPPKLRAHPDFVEYMRTKLPQADPGVMGHVEIKVVPDLPFRWEMRYDGKTTVEDHNGRMFTVTPPPSPLSWKMAPPRVFDDMVRPFRAAVHAMNRPIVMTRPQFKALMRCDLSGYGWKPARPKRASKGWRRHVRRMKAADKREGL